MAKRSFSFFPTILVFGAWMLAASAVQAQWTVLKAFPSLVTSIYFLDQQGSPTTGFVGIENSTIWRTTDNGVTWNQVTSPATATRSEVTAFTFRTALQGWCSVRDVFNISGAIWETTDGGLTWNSVFSPGVFVSIAFCPASNMLSAPCWSDSAYQSANLGATWTRFAASGQNGAAFSGSNGVIGNLRAFNPLYSVNGGITWNDAPSLSAETWSPFGIPGTNTFVAAAEKTGQFFISLNGGANWLNPYTFGANAIPTGCITGTAADLFVQTLANGFYYSSDLGLSWTNICGPVSYRDTRFYSVGTQIFAGDGNNNLWYIANAPSGASVTVHLDRTSIDFSTVRCVTADSVIRITSNNACTNGVLTKVQLLSGAPSFSLQGISFPDTLLGNDSVGIEYTPSTSLRDSGKVLLEFNLGNRLLDTIITLYGTARHSTNYSHEPYLQLTSYYACTTKDSAIVIRNLSCDTLTLTGTSLSDSSHFQLLSIFPKKLPQTIAPGGSDTIPVAGFSLQDGSFTSELELQMLSGGTVTINDSVPLSLKVFQGGHAEIGALNLSVLDDCAPVDTVISIAATPCDSIVLLNASLSDSSIFQMGMITLPTVIPASGGVKVGLHIQPGHKGIDSTLLHLRFRSGSATIDTTIALKVHVLYDLPIHVVVKDTFLDMGVVNVPCAAASEWITFGNSLCKALTIKSMAWERADSEFTLDPTPLPITLAKDTGIDSILIHFRPDSANVRKNRLRITLDVGGVLVDTFLTIAGVGFSSFHDSLLTPVLSIDTILSCRSHILIGKIVNLSCDSVTAASASLLKGINYAVDSPVFPVKLGPGDTLFVHIRLQPEQTDSVTDSAMVTILDPVDGSDHVKAIFLSGFVVPNSHVLTVSDTAFSLNSIAPCSFADSTFVLTNKGTCDDVVVTDTTFTGYPGVTFMFPASLPIVLHPDSAVLITFHVVPNSDTLVSTKLTLHGQNIDTEIAIHYASRPGGNAVTFSAADSVFTTKPCIPISKTFWIANVGCKPSIIDTIELGMLPNESQYSLKSIPAFPFVLAPGDTLFDTVQFDPNGNGNGVASLEVRSQQASYDRSIPLTGSAVGIIPTARIEMEASDHTEQAAGFASDTTNVALVLLDDIGDTTGLQTVSLTLAVNWNLLTLTKLVPAAGWSIADTIRQAAGDLAIRMRHDGGGAVAAGTEIIHCYFAIAVTDSASCDIAMSGLRFNDSSALYDGCTLTSIAMSGVVHFSSMDTCGTPLIRGLLNGTLALKIISVRPNPVSLTGGNARVDLGITLAHAGAVTITLSDMLGREQWRTTVLCSAGSQTLPLELPNISEGSFFIQAASSGMKDSRKVTFESGIGKN